MDPDSSLISGQPTVDMEPHPVLVGVHVRDPRDSPLGHRGIGWRDGGPASAAWPGELVVVRTPTGSSEVVWCTRTRKPVRQRVAKLHGIAIPDGGAEDKNLRAHVHTASRYRSTLTHTTAPDRQACQALCACQRRSW